MTPTPESSIPTSDLINPLCRDGHMAAVDRLVALEEEVERLRLQLAACGVAAMANTEESIKGRIGPDNPYYCASYADVCRAVDREMALRAELARPTVHPLSDDLHQASELLRYRAANLIEALDSKRPRLLDLARKLVTLEGAVNDYDQAKGQQS